MSHCWGAKLLKLQQKQVELEKFDVSIAFFCLFGEMLRRFARWAPAGLEEVAALCKSRFRTVDNKLGFCSSSSCRQVMISAGNDT